MLSSWTLPLRVLSGFTSTSRSAVPGLLPGRMVDTGTHPVHVVEEEQHPLQVAGVQHGPRLQARQVGLDPAAIDRRGGVEAELDPAELTHQHRDLDHPALEALLRHIGLGQQVTPAVEVGPHPGRIEDVLEGLAGAPALDELVEDGGLLGLRHPDEPEGGDVDHQVGHVGDLPAERRPLVDDGRVLQFGRRGSTLDLAQDLAGILLRERPPGSAAQQSSTKGHEACRRPNGKRALILSPSRVWEPVLCKTRDKTPPLQIESRSLAANAV
jgi:hypothetical protein